MIFVLQSSFQMFVTCSQWFRFSCIIEKPAYESQAASTAGLLTRPQRGVERVEVEAEAKVTLDREFSLDETEAALLITREGAGLEKGSAVASYVFGKVGEETIVEYDLHGTFQGNTLRICFPPNSNCYCSGVARILGAGRSGDLNTTTRPGRGFGGCSRSDGNEV